MKMKQTKLIAMALLLAIMGTLVIPVRALARGNNNFSDSSGGVDVNVKIEGNMGVEACEVEASFKRLLTHDGISVSEGGSTPLYIIVRPDDDDDDNDGIKDTEDKDNNNDGIEDSKENIQTYDLDEKSPESVKDLQDKEKGVGIQYILESPDHKEVFVASTDRDTFSNEAAFNLLNNDKAFGTLSFNYKAGNRAVLFPVLLVVRGVYYGAKLAWAGYRIYKAVKG